MRSSKGQHYNSLILQIWFRSYKEAEDILRATFDMVTKIAEDNDESISTRWEPLLNNLGHACRKNKKYDEALAYHKQVGWAWSPVLSPRSTDNSFQ